MQYCMPKDKHINIIQQQFRRAIYSSSQINKAIFLIEDQYKGLREDITRLTKSHSYTGRAFQSQPSQLRYKYYIKQEILQEVL